MNNFLSNERGISVGSLLLRFGLVIVFLWFGFSQLSNPSEWTVFLPSWVKMVPISENHFVMLNGLFEVVSATLLLLGAYVRITALLLGLHLVGIAFSIGITSTGVRDFGLSIATLSLALLGSRQFSIDSMLEDVDKVMSNKVEQSPNFEE